ncbi:MAG: hypothetical protein F6K40_19360 [Okeania sp. SIO3I5]|uniref:hypothetical protein n=1 Tax=Okeania sp. SIO3I5 TaxID=2607805 RepID=UPI0013BDE0D7|nr:hypothetical protein [Okeania sp. SIO3I5]NEQ38303.1 hypothetical protein [Okeania sp. SIO3I5]
MQPKPSLASFWHKIDPTRYIGKIFKIPFEYGGEATAKAALAELNKFIKSDINPLLDDVFKKVDDVAAKNILRSEEAAKILMEDGKKNILEIENEVVEDIDQILEIVDDKYRGAMQETFSEINRARAEALIDVRYTLGTVDRAVEARINQITLEMMRLLAKVDEIVQKAPETLYNDLFSPTLTRLEELQQDTFNQLDELVKKLDCSTVGTIKEVKLGIEASVKSIRPFSLPLFPTYCEKKMGTLAGTEIYLYRLYECEINEILAKRAKTLTIQQILDNYSQLELHASQMVCLAKRSNATGIMESAQSDWAKYGMEYRRWRDYLNQ